MLVDMMNSAESSFNCPWSQLDFGNGLRSVFYLSLLMWHDLSACGSAVARPLPRWQCIFISNLRRTAAVRRPGTGGHVVFMVLAN